MNLIAIDPGPVKSGFVIVGYNRAEKRIGRILDSGIPLNDEMARIMTTYYPADVVIEKIASYGMPVSESIFETVYWTGIFSQIANRQITRIPRKDVKIALCNSMKAKDANIRQALIDIYGEPGTKKAPGLLYGVSKDIWAAVALAHTYIQKT